MSTTLVKHFMEQPAFANPKGYIALVSVLVTGAVGTVLAVALILLGLSSSRSSLSDQQAYQARGLANACAEEGLQQIRDVNSFTGSGGLSIGQGTCTYTVTDLGGENREIESVGTVNQVVRKVDIFLNQINPNIGITSWTEVASF